MNYWIFVITTHKEDADQHTYTGEEIFVQRTTDRFWGLGKGTPNRASLEKGDRVVFYIGTPNKVFAGTAVLASQSFGLSDAHWNKWSHGKHFYRAEYGVQLTDIDIWAKRKSVSSLIQRLSFIENQKFWGTYFQGGVRGISEADFKTITEDGAGDWTLSPGASEIESQSEFALETHLEEFIDTNWDSIDFGARFERYKTNEQDGRQFPAGPWSIDFFCKDLDTGDFIVVELKRGKTSDSVIGQTLRYMVWVRENLASSGEGVRGLIIAKELDDSLKYSLRAVKDVSALAYSVSFRLEPFAQ